MFNEQQTKLVKKSFAFLVLKTNGEKMNDLEIANAIVKPFYEKLFLFDPNLAQYFNHLNDTSCIFAKYLKDIVESLGAADIIDPLVQLSKRHIIYAKEGQFSITLIHFDLIEKALITTLLNTLQERGYQSNIDLAEIKAAWHVVFEAISDTMKKVIFQQ